MKWYIAHIIPRIHWTKYRQGGVQYIHIWRQWLWFCWDQMKFKI